MAKERNLSLAFLCYPRSHAFTILGQNFLGLKHCCRVLGHWAKLAAPFFFFPYNEKKKVKVEEGEFGKCEYLCRCYTPPIIVHSERFYHFIYHYSRWGHITCLPDEPQRFPPDHKCENAFLSYELTIKMVNFTSFFYLFPYFSNSFSSKNQMLFIARIIK